MALESPTFIVNNSFPDIYTEQNVEPEYSALIKEF